MTVKELRSILAQCPDDLVVTIDNNGVYLSVMRVQEREVFSNGGGFSYYGIPYGHHVAPVNAITIRT